MAIYWMIFGSVTGCKPRHSITLVPPYLKSFDGSPIYDDYAVLAKWWANRLTLPAPRVTLYYNSISLHSGNRYASNHASNSREIYHPRLLKLLDNLDRFFASLSASGRRAVVVFVTEHGAAMRGDKMQISGMREIPRTGIGIVPVAIKLIGLAGNEATQPQIISQASSHLTVATLLSNFISRGFKFEVQQLRVAWRNALSPRRILHMAF